MIIGIAQTRPIKGEIAANISLHKQFAELAASLGARALFFPELSLTGYEPELAKALAINPDDKRLNDFQHISDIKKMAIGLGIPTKAKMGIRISMIVFQPDKPRRTYSKQHLHSDELPYFESGDGQMILTVKNKKIAPAICYESLQPAHAAQAVSLGAELYLASVAKSQNGVNKAMTHYPEMARSYTMPVLMSNCVGFCDNFLSVGGSAVWTKQGHLARQLDDKQEGLLIFDTETEAVTRQIL